DVPLARLDQATVDRIVAGTPDVADVYALTALQQGMLFHSLADAGSGVYVEQLVSTLRGPLDVTAFQAAWDQVVARHAVFRTSFLWSDVPEPLQVVQRAVTLPWQIEDWRALPAAEQEARFAAFRTADRRQGLDLTQAPLLRLALMRVADAAHYFVWTVHHLLFDGWSLPLVLNEVFTTYEARVSGRAIQQTAPRPYRDYIAWLQGQDLAQAEAFWRHTLAGFTAPTPLGVDRLVSSDNMALGYARERQHLSAETTATLNALARQHGLTLNTVVQGAWALLLSRYSGEPDVLFGATVAGRPAELTGVERMVGLFINTLPVRVRVRPADSLLAWLSDIQAQQAEQRQYEWSPLSQVQGWSEVPRGQALFESLIVFENYPAIAATAQRSGSGALTMTDRRGTEQSNYPLTVAVGPERELEFLITYDRQRFDAVTIRRLLGHLATILTDMAADPHQRLTDVPLLTASEQQRLAQWNTTAEPFAQDRLVHELLAAQAVRTPESIALVCGEDCTTYAGLEAHANRLAHYLQALGVGPETRVALFLERSLDLVVALLAVWKAGGAYVPIDPSYPAERIAFILQDAAASVVLTEGVLWERLPAHTAPVVCLDRDAEQLANQPDTAPLSAVGPANLAYLIYTSGTTGTPKAVAVEHGNLLQVLHASQTIFGYHATDIQPWIASVAFDIAVFELVNPLLAGGTVVIETPSQVLDLPQLVQDLENWTLLHAVPSLLRQIVEHARQTGTPDAYAGLRRIWVGGDAVPPELLADTLAVFPQAELVVLYGPTEGTIICACHVVDPDAVPTRQLIGRPLPNAQLRLYDAHGQLVPVGVAGEIYLGGGSVTRGYLNRPELTAEKFVGLDGGRWYRTGDRARYLADGTLEFLGRTDNQVKIRGFRIEIGEVEAVLAQHPAIREAVVLARADGGRDLRLVAYLVPETEIAPTTEALRDFLLATLPAYMVPSAFVVLEALPLTSNGKVDRKALPAPEQARGNQDDRYIAPQTVAEATLARIWAEVLRLDRVSIHDNFFALGGDSILSIQIVARAGQAGLRLTPRQLFDYQTIAALSAVVDTAPLVVAEQGLVTGAAPLTPIQQHFFARELPEPHHFNQSVVLEPTERLDAALVAQAIQYLLIQHDALRLRFHQTEAGWQQTHAGLESRAVWSVVDLSDLAPDAQQTAFIEQCNALQASLNLEFGPLLRAALFELGAEQGQRLLVVVHHLAVDWVSWAILVDDLDTAYRQLAQGGAVVLPAKTTAFGQWAERLSAAA
ncbi:MAG: amino acid adenylation domain-containing protein, partial [Chloroflexi bacterium]|nr:amino acid adenylation domain-containing protein [Chloroflexota bacterium]